MTTRTELMATGMPATQAKQLGADTIQLIAPAGTNQATATPILSPLSKSTTTGASTGILLPPADSKSPYSYYNGGANPCLVYPTGTATINGATSFSVTNGKCATFWADGVNWLANLSA